MAEAALSSRCTETAELLDSSTDYCHALIEHGDPTKADSDGHNYNLHFIASVATEASDPGLAFA